MTVTVSKTLFRWMIALAVISPLAATGLGFLYTNSVDEKARHRSEMQQRQADHRWCDLFDLYVDPSQPPPTTERGKQQLEKFVILYRSLGCETK